MGVVMTGTTVEMSRRIVLKLARDLAAKVDSLDAMTNEELLVATGLLAGASRTLGQAMRGEIPEDDGPHAVKP